MSYMGDYVPAVGNRVYTAADFEILNEVHVGHALYDFTPGRSRIMWGNDVFCHTLGKTQDQLLKTDMNKLNSEAERAEHQRVHEKVQINKQCWQTHQTILPEGKAVTARCHYRPIRVQYEDSVEYNLVLKTIIPLNFGMGAEEEDLFRRSDQLLRFVAVLAMCFDAAGEELFANLAAEAFYHHTSEYGRSLVEERRLHLDDILASCIWSDDAEREQILQKVKELRIESKPVEFFCRKRVAGEPSSEIERGFGKWHKIRCIPSVDPATNNFCIVVTEVDVTTIKRAEQELLAASKAQEKFFSSISHELRAPLNGIVGLSEALMQDEASTDRVQKCTHVIRNCAQRLNGLVNDILDSASSKRGTLVVKAETVDLREVAGNVVAVMSPLLKRGVTLINALEDEPSVPAVVGDAARISQILTNLIANAMRFTEHGQISVAASVLPEAQMVRVAVSDSGVGIPAGKQAGIWGAFQQVDVSTTRKYGGTGLGLALVKDLVKAHGGEVGLTSTYGGSHSGSCFTFTLPCACEESLTSRGPAREPEGHDGTGSLGAARPGPGPALGVHAEQEEEQEQLVPGDGGSAQAGGVTQQSVQGARKTDAQRAGAGAAVGAVGAGAEGAAAATGEGRGEDFVFTSLEQLEVLNLLDDIFMMGDWVKGQKRWLFVNDAFLKSFGGTREKTLAYDFSGQTSAMDSFQEQAVQRCQQNGEVFEKCKTVHYRGTSRMVNHRFRPIWVQLPGWPERRRLFLSDLHDLTGEEGGRGAGESGARASMDLRIATELLEHSETITMMFDAETEVLEYGNCKAKEFYEHGAGQRALKALDDVLSCLMWEDEARRAKVTAQIRALRPTDSRLHFRCRIARPGQDGEAAREAEVWHLVHVVPAFHPCKDAHTPVLMVSQTDVTTTHKQSVELAVLYEEQLAAKQREQFLSAMSHELRTPLNGIIGLSDSLMVAPECTDKMKKILTLVRSSGQRLASLISDILDTASAREGKVSLKVEVVELQEVAQIVGEMLRPTVPDLVTLVNKMADQPLPPVEADRSRLIQVLTNLLSNAIKFTHAGSITLQARVLSEEEVLVEVQDTGCGIPRDKWDQVWKPFSQADMSSTRTYGGTGLGLSLVKELVDAHHGRVGLSSQESGAEKGSVVFFVLPLKQPGQHLHSNDGEDGARHCGGARPRWRDLGHKELVPGTLLREAANAPPRKLLLQRKANWSRARRCSDSEELQHGFGRGNDGPESPVAPRSQEALPRRDSLA